MLLTVFLTVPHTLFEFRKLAVRPMLAIETQTSSCPVLDAVMKYA